MTLSRTLPITLTAALLAAPASGQLALDRILGEGDAVSYTDGSLAVLTSVDVLRFGGDTNDAGDFAFQLDTADGVAHIAGYSAGTLSILRTASAPQTGIDGEIGLGDDGSLAYTATIDDGSGGNLRAVFLDDTAVLTEGDAAANGASNFLDVHNTGAGQLTFFGGSPDTGLFLPGNLNSPGIGDSVTLGADTFTLDAFGEIDHDFEPGVGSLVRADLAEAGSTADGIVLLDGMPIASGAGFLREGDPAPGTGANWDNFDFLDINALGDTLITGDLDGSSDTDEFVAYNGQILFSELDTVGGVTLDGGIESADLNDSGDWAVVWDDDQGNELLLVGSAATAASVLLTEGDAITLDGVAATWTDFDIALRLSERRSDGTFDIFLLGNVDGGGTSDDVYVTLTVPEPASLALLAAAAPLALRRRR